MASERWNLSRAGQVVPRAGLAGAVADLLVRRERPVVEFAGLPPVGTLAVGSCQTGEAVRVLL
jgi:hypothetical protein